jgi:hypothetical protein
MKAYIIKVATEVEVEVEEESFYPLKKKVVEEFFHCQADDIGHAKEQALDAFSGGKVLVVFEECVEEDTSRCECGGTFEFAKGCGAWVCDDCDQHRGLARCFCGWSESGGDGRAELEDMGETIEEADY